METIQELKFEYKFVTRYEILEKIAEQNLLKHKTNYSDVLNELGKDGWELVSVLQYSENSTYIFKRAKWVEKKVDKAIDCPQNHQDSSHPNGCIVLEDFNGGEGFYKLNLDYLNKKQVEEIEEMIRTWNADKKELKKIENPAAWSEEDENNLTDTCVAIRKFYHGTNGAQELIDWLQVIKQRIKGE